MGTSWSAKQMLAHYTTYYASDNPAVRDAMATIARNAFDNVATFVNQQNMQDALGQVAYQSRLRYEQRQQQLYEINLQYQADMAAIQAENDALLFYHTVNQTATVLKDPSFATHTVLDVVGLIPVVGEPADLLNATIYLAEGNYLDASLSAAGAIPFAGWAASGAQIVKSTYRAANAAMEVADTVSDGIRLADSVPLSAATPPASTITSFDPVPPMVKMPEAPIALPKTPDVAPPLKQIEAAPVIKQAESAPTGSARPDAATMSQREVLGVGDEVVVIGRLPDTTVLKEVDGYRVLDVDNWTPEFNAAWVDEAIDQKRIVYTASPTDGNYWDVVRQEPTVFAQEVQQFREAGYTWDGHYLVPPLG